MFLIAIYLIAIVVANLTIAYFGPAATPVVAFLFIGLDMTARDLLHERWQGRNLARNMTLLIASGSLISWLLNQGAAEIAIASLAAFALSGSADTLMYHLLRRYPRLVKVNGSNVVSSAVDSIVFPTMAFGLLLPEVVLAQFAAKVGGGYVWSLILNRFASSRNQGRN